ncbi:MAG: hypothetical protein U9N73_11160, partial [Candidatus Auribacterota bacterium]|nr:hypothetical protein [Candidatus Auribacterota bacterium]
AEADNLGFMVYRAIFPDGPYVRISEHLILGFDGSPAGARYLFIDRGVENGVTYYYELQAIDTGGESEWYGPVEATATGTGGEFIYDPADYAGIGVNERSPIPLPTAHSPLPTPSPLPTAYSPLPTPHSPLPTAYCLLPPPHFIFSAISTVPRPVWSREPV